MKSLTRSIGFTLIELLFTIAVAAILLSLAAPSMQSNYIRSSVRGYQQEINSALNYARGEALARSEIISMCPSADATNCDTVSENWTNGWLIFIDDGAGSNYANGTLENDETLIRVFENTGSNTLRMLDPDNANAALASLSWNYRGFTDSEGRALMVICPKENDVQFARGLFVDRSGRVLLSRDTDNDSVHESVFENDAGVASIAALTCP